MSSITEREQNIKATLLTHLEELSGFISEALVEQHSADTVEKGLWKRMLAFGHQALGVFFSQCGTGDEGQVVTLPDGRSVKRFPSLHSRPYLTVFGEYSLPRYVYGRREGQAIDYVPLDARLLLPERKFSYLLQDWNQAMATDLPFGKVTEHLERLLGFPQSVNSLEQNNHKLSESVEDFWKHQVMPVVGEASEAPEGEAPESEAPESEAPESEAPESEAPESEAPESEAPESKAPESKAPESKAPESKAPESKAPESKAPESKAPESKAPESKAPESKAPKSKVTVVTADGKGVVMRPSELDAKVSKSSKQSGRPGHKKMALIGSVYTVEAYLRSPEQVLAALFADLRVVSDDSLSTRPKPLNKRVRGALLRNEQGKTDPQSVVIFSWLAAEARQRQPGLPEKKPLVLVMDGQESLWNEGLKHLPENEFAVTEILDLIHATQYVWTATHLFYPKGSPQATTHAREQIGQLLNNQVNTVINAWREKAVKEKLCPSANESLETVCGYFTNHAHRMRYKDYLEKGWPVASGVIEGACRNVVKDRMEHSGMRWTMKGAHAMLELRSVCLSHLWDDFMQYWRERENQRLYPLTQAANDELFTQANLA